MGYALVWGKHRCCLVFYEDFFTGLGSPRAPRRPARGRAPASRSRARPGGICENEVEEFWYEAATFSTPGDEFFTNVNTLNCSKHAHAEAPSRARLGA